MKLPSLKIRLDCLLLGLFAFLVFAPGFWWGAPHATNAERKQSWGVDDETPLGPLAELHNIIDPKPDRNLGYPLMYSFVVVAAYAPYLGYLKITGQWSRISGEYPFGLSDPVTALKVMTWIAHFVTVLMAVGIVLAMFGTGLVLKNRRTGVLAALFAMTSFPMFYYARTGNVDVPMLFFAALTLMMLARCVALGFTVHRSIWMGAFGGFALGTKEQVLGMFLVIPIVFLMACWREYEGRWKSLGFWKFPMVAGLSSFIALGLGSGMFVDPSRYFAHVEFLRDRMDVIAKGEVYLPFVFPFGWAENADYLYHLVGLLQSMITLPGLLLGVGGVAFLFLRRSSAVWFAIIAAAYFLFAFYSFRSPQMRYFIPLTFLLALPAASLVEAAWAHRNPAVRWGFMLVAVAVIAVNLLRGAGLTYEMIEDSRYQAASWLTERLVPGDTVEYFGPRDKLPALEAEVLMRESIEWKGIYSQPSNDDATIKEIVEGWEERRPRFIIIMPDVSSPPGIEHSNSCPRGAFEILQDPSQGFTLEAEFRTPPLLPWLPPPALDYPTVNPPIRVFSMVR